MPSIQLLLTFYESTLFGDFRNTGKCMFHSILIFGPEVDLFMELPLYSRAHYGWASAAWNKLFWHHIFQIEFAVGIL